MSEHTLDFIADELLSVMRKHVGDDKDINILFLESTMQHVTLKIETHGKQRMINTDDR
ncbi:hypothetical protein [Plesiomonas sp.]|uniref:hypothetical protein n=1 Tax=Plesiomonas sp. TaxID=2486279 RepID=UPI003F664A2C